MKTTHQWLESICPTGLSAREVADILTFSGTEVEHMTEVGADTAFQIEVTSNRVDCLGVIGLAREIGAVTGRPLKLPEARFTPRIEKHGVTVEIEPSAIGACPWYTAQIIKSVHVKPSPDWLKNRLEAVGIASINNIVDITNFVMLEYCQPLHAFDLDHLHENRIVVRMGRKGETFTAINHKVYELSPADLVIADADRAVAIAGIMGGVDSEVTRDTVDVLLESAYFEPLGIKASGKKLDRQHSDNLASEARYRFERGVDPQIAIAASRRATKLILEIAGGETIGELLVAGKEGKPWLRDLRMRVSAVERSLGSPVPAKRCAEILGGLGLQIVAVSESELTVRVPSFRRDLEREIDLVEEIGRIEGLDKFPSRLTLPVSRSRPNPLQEDVQLTRDIMRGLGFDEALTDTFVPRDGAHALSPWETAAPLEARVAMNLARPALRTSVIPSLVGAYALNERRGNKGVRLYEIASAILTNSKGETTAEKKVLALVAPDFDAIKGALDALFERLHIPALELADGGFALFAGGSCAEYRVDGKRVGVLGKISDAATREFDIAHPCAAAEIDLVPLLEKRARAPRFVHLPRFPEVSRDLAVVVDETVRWAAIADLATKHGGQHLREVRFFDEFRGKQVAKGKKSIAFALRFRDDNRTLTGDEVDAAVKTIVNALSKSLGAEL
ncbi:MAG: phenylalanine--tRNA ligase subunit beta, partial [Planctomycetes bacterium]|nr:phenylalanine--tRNA ligase subunit beta [Planctomycetota bacterium]